MKIKTILCMLLLSLCSIAVTAQEAVTDPVKGFTFTGERNNTATLTNYTGSGGAVTLPDTVSIKGTRYPVTAIGDSAFKDHSDLTSVILSGPVRIIGENAFRNCSSLTSVTIGDKVDSIGMFAFADCNSLTDVYVAWPAPLSITTDVFYGLTFGNTTLHVPAGKETAYRVANTWKQFHIPVALSVTPETTNVAAGGDTVSLKVTANVDWKVSSNASWATVSPSSGSNNGTVSVTAAANTGDTARTVTITVSGGDSVCYAILTQAAPRLSVTPATIDWPVDSATVSFKVTANIDWSVSSNASWVTVSPASGSNNGTVTVTAAANTGDTARIVTITVSGGNLTANVTLTQPITPVLDVTPETTDLPVDNGTVSLEVTANVDWSVVSSEAWAVVTPASGKGNDTVTVTVQANDAGAQRTVTITFRSASHTRTVTLTQAAPMLSVTPETTNLPTDSGKTSFAVTANVAWSVSSDAPWIIVDPVSGSGNRLVTVSAAANPGSSRTAVITVSGGNIDRTVTVTQPAGDREILVDPVPPAAGDEAGGQLILRLNIPANETISGSCRISLPAGLNLDPESTKLAGDLAGSYERFISQTGNGVWQLVIRRRTAMRNGTNTTMRDIIYIVWNEDRDLLPPGAATYEIKITDLTITLGDQLIRRDQITVPVTAGATATTGPFEDLKIWSHGGLLHVHTPQAEQIEIYALTGQLLCTVRKDAGPAVIRLTALPRGILVVHGDSGWTEKIVNK